MSRLEFVALVLALVGPLLAVARRLGLPPSLLLFGAGVASTFVPGLPPVRVEPSLLTELFLPAILYAATVRVTWHLLRFTLLPGVIGGAVLSIVTILAVALAAQALLPSLGWSASLLLGGAGAGLAIGRLSVWLRGWAVPPPVEIAVTLATPYLGALAAAFLGISVVVTITVAALTVSAARVDPETGAAATSPEARISATAFWEAGSLLVSSLLYLLAGRALPEALGALDEWPLWLTAGTAAAILALVLLLQFGAGLASTAAPRIARALRRKDRQETRPGQRNAAAGRRVAAAGRRVAAAGVMAWASTRSVIGLVVALSVPAELPGGQRFAAQRDLVLVVATLVVLGSVLLQGLTLRAAVQAAALGDEEEEREEQERALRAATAAAEQAEGPEGLDAARRASLRLRERDRIGDEVLHKTLREADLRARADEGPAAALPGAGPPNP